MNIPNMILDRVLTTVVGLLIACYAANKSAHFETGSNTNKLFSDRLFIFILAFSVLSPLTSRSFQNSFSPNIYLPVLYGHLAKAVVFLLVLFCVRPNVKEITRIFRIPRLTKAVWGLLILAIVILARIDLLISQSLIRSSISFIQYFIYAFPEEIWFRGIVFTSFLERFDLWRSIFFSSALFSWTHLPKLVWVLSQLEVGEGSMIVFLGLFGFASSFFIGCAFGLIFKRVGNIWIPVLIHAAANFGGFLLLRSYTGR